MVFGFWECFPKFSLPLGKHHGVCSVHMHNFWSPKELMYLQGNYHCTHKFSDSECAVLALGSQRKFILSATLFCRGKYQAVSP